MTTDTIESFLELSDSYNDSNEDYASTGDEEEPDLTDYRAFEQVLRYTKDGARQKFIRDLLNTTTDLRKQSEKLKNDASSSSRPAWLKNTKRPENDNIHDHFIKYKQASAENCKKRFQSVDANHSERPITRGGFFDDVVLQLFEGNNADPYDNLDLTGVVEAADNEWDGNKIYSRSEKDTNEFEEGNEKTSNNNSRLFHDVVKIDESGKFIGSVNMKENKNFNDVRSIKETSPKNRSQFKEYNENPTLLSPKRTQDSHKTLNFKDNPLKSHKYRPMDLLQYMDPAAEDTYEAVLQDSDEEEE